MSAPEQLQEVTFEYIDEVNPNLVSPRRVWDEVSERICGRPRGGESKRNDHTIISGDECCDSLKLEGATQSTFEVLTRVDGREDAGEGVKREGKGK
jgi:hypothetical protein